MTMNLLFSGFNVGLGSVEVIRDSDDEDLSVGGNMRGRAYITDGQLKILRTLYRANPKPTNEQILKVAEQIQHPYRVVKVCHFHHPNGKTLLNCKFHQGLVPKCKISR